MTLATGSSELTAARLKELLFYNPETGVFSWLIWRSNKTPAGSIAGSTDLDGYRLIRVDGRLYRACRLAWLYTTGEWPPVQVDHRDLNSGNDRWDNLRLATNSQNSMNKGLQANNTSGFKGVFWSKRDERWIARIKAGSKSIGLGYFSNPQAAHVAYCAAARSLHGEFSRTSNS